MNVRKTKFVREPRHALDMRCQRETVQAVNSLLNSKVIVGQTAQFHHSDSNLVLEIPDVGAVQDFQVVSDGGDYYNCNMYDGETAGSAIIKVAKHQDIRCTLPTDDPSGGAWPQKTIRGITYTYTYAPTPGSTTDGVDVIEYVRGVVGDDSSTATSYITPCLNVGDIITADKTSFAAPDTLLTVTWQAQASGRAWADKKTS